jgi:hypothetical protein
VTFAKFEGACRGVRPHVSNAASDGFLVVEADSIELKLDVRPCRTFCDNPPLVDLWREGFRAVGGSIETAFGLSFGLMICEAPFL